VLGHRRTTDRKPPRDFHDRQGSAAELFQDRSPGAVAEGVEEGIGRDRLEHRCVTTNRSCRMTVIRR
jgi:hypothetical protein